MEKVYNLEEITSLIKQYSTVANEVDLPYELIDDNMSHLFAEDASGLAELMGELFIRDQDPAEYFAETFELLSPNKLYRAPKGYYFLFMDLEHKPDTLDQE